MMSVPIPISVFFFFNDTATTEIYTLSLHDALPIYLFYLQMNDIAVVGSSPERLVKVQGRDAFYRPIAGTQPRGKDEAEDLRLEKELLASEKERAEHIMLVDLGRNDLGRVCDYGTVKVEQL